MHTAIEAKYQELAQKTDQLQRVFHEGQCLDRVGSFAHIHTRSLGPASIFFHPEAGAHLVLGAIREKYRVLNFEVGFLGYPLSDEERLSNAAGFQLGSINRFQGGSVVFFDSDKSIAVYRADGTLVTGPSGGHAAQAALQLVPPTRTSVQLETMAVAVKDLLEVVALQQAQLAQMSTELNALSLLRIQTEVSDHASNHLQKALQMAVGSLQSTRGEVTVGATTHKGTLRIARQSDDQVERTGKRHNESSTVVSIENKLKATAAGLGGAEAGFKLDVRGTQKLIDEMGEKSRRTRAEDVEGTFEVHHDAITLKLGR